jgi:L-methionine (R)-S-oxide reductase
VSEGLLLTAVPRGSLLSAQERLARLREAAPQIAAILEGERDPISLQSTLACLLYEALPQASFAGFYRRVTNSSLAVGPYQGPMGCLRIDFARGVCGAAARLGETQLVADVHAFPGHIACDAGAASELVIPVFAKGVVQAVLDLDSRSPDAFSRAEAEAIEALLARIFDDQVAWASSWN